MSIGVILSMADFANRDWRAILLFLFKEGRRLTRLAERLKSAFGDCAPARSTVSKWFCRFPEGWETLEAQRRASNVSATDENAELFLEAMSGRPSAPSCGTNQLKTVHG